MTVLNLPTSEWTPNFRSIYCVPPWRRRPRRLSHIKRFSDALFGQPAELEESRRRLVRRSEPLRVDVPELGGRKQVAQAGVHRQAEILVVARQTKRDEFVREKPVD